MRDCQRITCSAGLTLLLLWFTAHAGWAKDNAVVLINVFGSIDSGLAPFTHRALQEAERLQAAAVILHMNTPGGRVDAAIQMRDALLDSKVETIAFINKEAYSAGALIALSCQRIYMTGGAVIGAATPVDQRGQKVGEKYVSAIRKLFRATAEQNGRPPDVAEAMVDEDVVVPDLIEKGKLLTLTTQEALTWGVADGQFDSLEALLTHLKVSPDAVTRLRINWAESLVRILTRPGVAALLLIIGLLGLWGEFLAPGFGLGGTVGILSLALLLGSHYLVGLAGWEEVLLMAAGILLLGIELLVIPGFGVAGVLGIVTLAAGVFLSFLGRYPSAADIWRVVMTLLSVFAVVGVGAGVMLLLLPTTPIWRRLSLHARLDRPSEHAPAPERPSPSPLLGTSGITMTPLLPSGSGLFGDRRLDIISESTYIPANTPVTIVHVAGNRLVVRPQKASTPPEQGEPNQEGGH